MSPPSTIWPRPATPSSDHVPLSPSMRTSTRPFVSDDSVATTGGSTTASTPSGSPDRHALRRIARDADAHVAGVCGRGDRLELVARARGEQLAWPVALGRPQDLTCGHGLERHHPDARVVGELADDDGCRAGEVELGED